MSAVLILRRPDDDHEIKAVYKISNFCRFHRLDVDIQMFEIVLFDFSAVCHFQDLVSDNRLIPFIDKTQMVYSNFWNEWY